MSINEWKNNQTTYIISLNKYEKQMIKDYTDDGHTLLRNIVIQGDQFDWETFYKSIGKGQVHFYELIMYKVLRILRQNSRLIPRQIKTEMGWNQPLDIETLKHKSVWIPAKMYKEAIGKIQKDINRLILNSPPLLEDMTVYRGTIDPYFKKDDKYISPVIVSTSLRETIALTFTGTDCCLKKIHVPKGCHVLYIEPLTVIEQEEEVLLPEHTSFVIEKEYIKNDKRVFEMKVNLKKQEE